VWEEDRAAWWSPPPGPEPLGPPGAQVHGDRGTAKRKPSGHREREASEAGGREAKHREAQGRLASRLGAHDLFLRETSFF